MHSRHMQTSVARLQGQGRMGREKGRGELRGGAEERREPQEELELSVQVTKVDPLAFIAQATGPSLRRPLLPPHPACCGRVGACRQ